MWNLKYDTNELIYKTETDSQTQRTDLGLPGVGGWRRDGLGVWDQQMQTIICRMDKQQGPTVQQRELYSISCNKPQWKKYEVLSQLISSWIPSFQGVYCGTTVQQDTFWQTQ